MVQASYTRSSYSRDTIQGGYPEELFLLLTLAVDPGLTTGMAFNIHGHYETLSEPDWKEVCDFIIENDFDNVIAERFITSRIHSHKYGIITVQTFGAVEGLCYARGITFTSRHPQHRIPLMPKAKELLQAARRPFTDHEHDSLAHLLAWERLHAKQGSTPNQE